ncbi:MAG TPA: DUF3501 family protein [Acidimicrobiales bacterium]|jgi:hypothetical protein|nr:DUF3501 family protein [Acidimicrobiales bacterium]
MRRLTLDDIADARAYERERAQFRDRVIALKKKRRVAVGPFVTLVFENRDTIRFQIQEMARVEKLYSDEAILHELDTYNPLIPDPGTLSATLFVELTSKDDLMEWLPKLVGIETALELRLADGIAVRNEVDEEHADQLTREDVTASVHYVRFRLTPEQVDAFSSGPVELAIVHPNYEHVTALSDDTRAELARDLSAEGADG